MKRYPRRVKTPPLITIRIQDIPPHTTVSPETVKNHEAQHYHRFTIAGMAMRGIPGEPQIPVYGSLFGISSPDNVSLQILDAEYETMRGYRIPPAPPFPVNSNNYLNVRGDSSVETNPTPAGIVPSQKKRHRRAIEVPYLKTCCKTPL